MPLDLFTPLYPDTQLHPQFIQVRDNVQFQHARECLAEVLEDFVDPDGNFVEQFQTTGFDSRTYELFLYAMFKAGGLTIDRTHESPDFILSDGTHTVCVEAVTANPSAGFTPYEMFPPERTPEELAEYLANELPIRHLYERPTKRS